MAWRRMGMVFAVDRASGWLGTHAQVPTPLLIEGRLRIYVAARPQPGLSLTTFVDLDPDNPRNLIGIAGQSLLSTGKPGSFDEHGIMPSCALVEGNEVWLYYSGWSRSLSVPYTNSTGLAISRDGGRSFSKIGEGPILGKTLHDPYSATSPFVMREGSRWHMWYCSGTGWHNINGKWEHSYDIKYAVSADGIMWQPTGHVAIAQRDQLEAITRPYVVRADGLYHMWYCYRGSHDFRDGGEAYRIGYGVSRDGVSFERRDAQAGFGPGDESWDKTMVAYPAIIDISDRRYLFYNGNGFGVSGFGCAQWCEDE
jgi:hypothetical protein